MMNFKSVQLFKDQTLGIGSYGKVCKAKCDSLICAAKLIHETLFDPMAQLQISPQREHRLPFRRFQQECKFLNTIRHPNIILYLGEHQDADTGLPVLLMELMDDSLTHFLECSTQHIPYHIQVNISHDVALALSFLHSNKVIHRDLSSNNVLLRGNVLAKVTDFGMARLADINPQLQATSFTSTMCPGTDVYMPPEAVKDKPVYTEKIDCFSFGVITLQILTQLFPKPRERMQELDLKHPELPPGTRTVMVRVREIDRRRSHIDMVNPSHPLLPLVLDCLHDDDHQRPSAEKLCESIASLKETTQYCDSYKKSNGDLAATSIQEACQPLQVQLAERNLRLQQKDSVIATREQQVRKCGEQIVRLNQIIQQLERDRIQQIQEKQSCLNRASHQLQERDKVIADFERQVKELKGQLYRIDVHKEQHIYSNLYDRPSADRETVIKLSWREGKKAPRGMDRRCDAVVRESVVYCRQFTLDNDEIYSYDTTTSKWSPIPRCPVHKAFAMAVVDGLLTTIGGFGEDEMDTNKVFSLTGAEGDGHRTWTEEFPPMPTKRYNVSALCTGALLIVAEGAKGDGVILTSVEILNTLTHQWRIVTALPQPLSTSSITVCGDRLYLLGGADRDFKWTQSVYSCSLTTFLGPSESHVVGRVGQSEPDDSGTWIRVADLPVVRSTAVSLHGQLIAIGGRDLNNIPTSNIHQYNASTNTWKVIGHMATPRYRCLAAVLPDKQLMVVGGWGSDNKVTDSVEFATVFVNNFYK